MTAKHSALFFLLIFVVVASGCNKASSSSNAAGAATANANQPAAQPANANTASASGNQNAAAPAVTSDTPRLLGTYEITEVHKDGVVTMISELKSTITFKPNGTYVRKSRKSKNPYHLDAGKFRVDGGDKLVLRIEFVQGEGSLPKPRLVSHQIKVSPDAEEIRMTSDDGKVAVYRRVKDE